ncbi:2-Hydroxyacid oxidase 1-like isoform X2 [Dermacentor variabilis]|uniref:2-Hydroxyacid oxidase 1-like isoform X2 n=1 Tax=Dermacentor variabilis TaxID=34621 RepID=UPI003F5C6D24
MNLALLQLCALGVLALTPPSSPLRDECAASDANCDNETIITVDDLRRCGVPKLNKTVRDYYESGADQEQTLRENVEAFKRWRMLYRVLVDVTNRQLNTTLLGKSVSMPFGIAPSAMQKMAHPDGENGTAEASQAAGTVMILSTLSSTPLEEVRAAAPNATLWLQLYVFKNRTVTQELLRRAERANFSAVVMTVDAPIWGQRIVDVRNAFTIPEGITLGNFDQSIYANFNVTNATSGSGLTKYTNDFFDQTLTWQDVCWLQNFTSLPIVLKGIITEDAKRAVEYGARAILVSNHGGRQLDGAPATIEALPAIMEAVGNSTEVYLDGGVRTGTDVLKALALGARAVFVGRPALWGLAYNGTVGVKKMLDVFRTELDRALALMGHKNEYVKNLALWPGESQRPSPQSSKLLSPAAARSLFWCSSQTYEKFGFCPEV